jgi:putative tRNA adenosine deaminase-associated protein
VTTRTITIARERGRWRAHAIDIDDAADLDTLADMIRDVGDTPAVAFVEEDDEYLAVVRVDDVGDPRVFLSDQRALAASPLAERLFGDALPPPAHAGDADEDSGGGLPDASPVGDPGLLADLGTGPDDLIKIITERGVLPSDAVAAFAERAGCGDLLDEVGG